MHIKSEKGSMAVYVSVVMLTMLLVLIAIFITSNATRKSQLLSAIKVKESYELDNDKVADIYDELVGSNVEPEQKLYEFSYTGAEQEFTAPANGYYRIQVWGAQGGQKDATYATGGKRRIFSRRSLFN